jgi:hypothetical protein
MVINIFGRRGSGKTTTIRGNIKYYRGPIFIIDVLGNFDDPSYIHTNSLPDALERLKEIVRTRKDLGQVKGSPVICLKTGDPALAAEYFSAAIWKLQTGGTLVLDEVDAVHFKENTCFSEYIRYGRNRGGDLITGCRRPAEMDKNITAAANKFYCFGTHEPRDIEYFEAAVFGEYAWELMKCPKYSGIFIDFDKNIRGKFRIDILGNVFHTEISSLE